MPDPKNLENLVERAVGGVLESLMPGLRKQLVRQVMQALEPELANAAPAPAAAAASAGGSNDTEKLSRALAAVQTGGTQVEILDALTESTSQFAARVALFVVRGTNAVGWRARGFSDDEAMRSTPLELSEGLAAKAIEARGMVSGPASEFTVDFANKFGASGQDGVMMPLMVRDKVVALIYADGGTDAHRLDGSALQSLVRVAGLWLEVFATRKAGGSSAGVSAPPQARSAAAAATPAPVAAQEPVAPPAPLVEAAPAAAPPAPAPDPIAIPAGADGEVHKKAKRFAKLLVDEIKLYNQGKVTEGRQNRDLYDRLKDDIEKSRASYDKRYGNTVAKDADYFNQELVRILADNDSALLGSNFRR